MIAGGKAGLLLSSMMIAATVAGCAVVANPLTPPPGSSAGFGAGYADGCRTAYHDVEHVGYDTNDNNRKDAARYAGEADYHAGWDRGYATCREDDLRAPFRYWGS